MYRAQALRTLSPMVVAIPLPEHSTTLRSTKLASCAPSNAVGPQGYNPGLYRKVDI